MFHNSNLTKLRIVAIDDGRFEKVDKKSLLFSIIMQNFNIIDFKITEIIVDGLDSTKAIFTLLSNLNFDLIMLNSITFAGFNIVDLEYLYLKLKKPIIVIINSKPNNRAILQALKKHFPDWKLRWSIVKKSGFIHTLTVNKRYKPIYFEVKGIDYKIVRNLIRAMTILGRYPEPIRVIRMIAKRLTTK